MEQESSDPINVILSEFGIRLNELEEKQRLLKDRVLLVGNNLISTKEDYDKQLLFIKKQLKEIESEIKSIKQFNERITNELSNFARKSELDILKVEHSLNSRPRKRLGWKTPLEVWGVALTG